MKKNNINLNIDEGIVTNSAINLKNLSFFIKDQKIIDDISLNINQGEFVSLIGLNGSGKSTLCKLIDGIEIQDAGDIYIKRILMDDTNDIYLKKDIAYVFQNPDTQFIGATLLDDIAFSLETRKIDPKLMDDIIFKCAKAVGLENYLEYEPCNLSGGQKQKAALATAIARNADILILDEATSMIDNKGKNEIYKIIETMKKNNPNLTILNITFNMDELLKSDRIIMLEKGKLALDINKKDLISHIPYLIKSNIELPFFYELIYKLKEFIDISKISSEEDLIKAICK